MTHRCQHGTRRSRWGSSGLLLLAALASGCGVAVPLEIQPFRIESSDWYPAWSPDGTHIAYLHYASESYQGVWLVDSAGAAPHQIVPGAWQSLDWSPDGTHLALGGNGIYSVNVNGGPPQAITTFGLLPRWSPTGNELAFQSYDTSGVGSIGLVSQDGSALRALAPPDTESWSEPDWSPDGTHLVHVRRLPRDGQSDLFVMDTTGHAAVRLTTDGNEDRGPVWSPDGQWIAWSIGTFPPSNELWLMKPDGTGAHMLAYGGDPSWSPDSRQLVYSVLQFNIVRLFAIDITTSRVRQITR